VPKNLRDAGLKGVMSRIMLMPPAVTARG
jgi:hypothetical protein